MRKLTHAETQAGLSVKRKTVLQSSLTASSPEGPLLARGPSQSHCSELFMVSSSTRSRLSGDIFIQHLRRLSSSPFSSPAHLSRMLSAPRGPSPSCAPIGPPVSLCRGDVSARRPCRAEWTVQPVEVTPKQLGTARHGHRPLE